MTACKFMVMFLMALMASQAMSKALDGTFMAARYLQWMAKHGRTYTDESEKLKRLEIFKTNVAFIESFNFMNQSFKLGVNQFADLTNEEFMAIKTGLKPTNLSRFSGGSFQYENVGSVPSSIDWRQRGAVTPVKNQGQCGSCWAFSAVAAVEGLTKLKTGKLISLSEQELVDCDKVNYGCNGGYMDKAFQFIKSHGGLATEAGYPYQAADGTCDKTKAASNAATIGGYEDVPANNEGALLNAVANQPVSVTIDAGGYAFQFYKTGVFTGTCGTSLNHGVAVVGYGAASDGTMYWLVKNSWGTGWGEGGYIRMQRGVADPSGLCGIAMMASYPTA